MESNSGDQKLTTEDLGRKKLELEIEQLQKEARVPRVLRPSYLSALIGLAGLLSLYYTGFFDRERQILELKKEKYEAEVRDFEAEKERLVGEVEALQEKEKALAEQLTRTQEDYEERIAALRQNTQRTLAELARMQQEKGVFSSELRDLQWAYLGVSIDEGLEMMEWKVFAASISESFSRLGSGGYTSGEDACGHLTSNRYRECLRENDERWFKELEWKRDFPEAEGEVEQTVLRLSAESHAGACRSQHITLAREDLPVSMETISINTAEFEECLDRWPARVADGVGAAD